MHKKISLMETEPASSPAPFLELAPRTDWNDPSGSEHCVQFYERDRFLTDSVSAFVAAGLHAGDAAVVVATAAHREVLETELENQGLDLAALRDRGQYFYLDAAESLPAFMRDGRPDEHLFMSVIGSVVARAARGGGRVRAFGEMVALLWAEGNEDGAIQLEKLWNELAKRHSFSLLCAYPIDGFRREANGNAFRHICQEHSRVIPAESYSAQADLNERLRCVTLLQQRAYSLEAEIAERKKSEYAWREQQTKFSVLVAVAQLGIWELDLLTNDLTCSDQCKAHFGLGPNEPVTYGRFFEMIHPEDRERVQSALRAAIDAKADYAAEYRVIDPAGQLRWISSMGRCFHNGSHRMFGVTQSITERKQAAEILEKTVAERTAELQQTISELEAFSYSISHDLRAPLRSMQGFADVLMEDCGETLGPEGQGYVERIRASAERMDRLIQDVLTFSRVARSEVNLEPVNLDHLLRGIVECYPNLHPPQADILIEGRLPYVLGKAAALTQCLSNLLGNAVKFVARGTRPQVRIWAEIIPARAQPAEQISHANSTRGASGAKLSAKPAGGTAHSAEGEFVRLFIEDNGIGIQQEAQEKIFAIFQRLSKGYEGTGIGLAIVKKAAERMGGRVGVHSEAGNGSTFWLELQAAEPPGV